MKTLKVMGIVGLVVSVLSWMIMTSYNNAFNYDTAIGWGFLTMFYLIALSIVAIVQARRNK